MRFKSGDEGRVYGTCMADGCLQPLYNPNQHRCTPCAKAHKRQQNKINTRKNRENKPDEDISGAWSAFLYR